jgi:hypothetical protein
MNSVSLSLAMVYTQGSTLSAQGNNGAAGTTEVLTKISKTRIIRRTVRVLLRMAIFRITLAELCKS